MWASLSGLFVPFITRHIKPNRLHWYLVPMQAMEILLSDFQESRMSALIQCFGFTVEPLGPLPLLVSEGLPYQVADWTKGNVFFSSRVTIEATGETQILQVFPVGGQTQDAANLVAMEYGNKRAGNTV